MRHLKYALIAALALVLPGQALADSGAYIQASWSAISMDDPSAGYRGSTETYSLDEEIAAGATLGWGFGDFAVELKVNYVEGDVPKIGSDTARSGSQYNYAAATIGAVYQIDRMVLDDATDIAAVPYIGLGFGADVGFADVQKDSEANCGPGNNASANSGCASGDQMYDIGYAYRASLGGLIELHENIGLDLNYDYVMGVVDTHFASAGLRVMF